ncbi:MAG: hypothetical protein ACYCZF_10330 [Anaerolineae bacterium]
MKRITQFADRHPRLTMWFVLAVGMVLILLLTSRHVVMLWTQRLALAGIAVLLAGGCAWIIGWDTDKPEA